MTPLSFPHDLSAPDVLANLTAQRAHIPWWLPGWVVRIVVRAVNDVHCVRMRSTD